MSHRGDSSSRGNPPSRGNPFAGGNPFAVLAEPSSRSKEQEAKKPVTRSTDKEDLNPQDTAQAGSSYSMGSLQRNLPHGNADEDVVKRKMDEDIALFKRMRDQ